MDYQLLVGIATFILGLPSLYFQYQQVRIAKMHIMASTTAESLSLSTVQSYRAPYFTMAIMVMLVIAAWVPYFINKPLSVDDRSVMRMWGIPPEQIDRPYYATITARGNLLLSYQSQYKVAAICYFYDGTTDELDVSGLQKSNLYDIQDGDIPIKFFTDEQFTGQIVRGRRGVNYSLLLVPKNVSMEQFTTMREAQNVGVIKLLTRAAVPY